MKAIQIDRFGGPEVLELVDVPMPVPGPGEVLVAVRAAGVNFADALMRADRYAMTPPLPSILGQEVTGVVAGHGAGVDGKAWPIGRRVAAPLFAVGRFLGGYAEHVVISADALVALPDDLPFEAATALMAQGLSALHLLQQAPAAGRTVLVSAAAGGVGSFLVQLAKRDGAKRVIAAASSPEKLAFARGLRADEVVNYAEPGWAEAARLLAGGAGPDLIFESAGGAITRDCLGLLGPRGRMMIYGALNIHDFRLDAEDLKRLIFMNQSISGFALVPLLTADSLRRDLTELFDLAARGQIVATIDSVHRLEDAAEAHRRIESRASRGKIILTP